MKASKNFFPDSLIPGATDNYKKYLDKFVDEFMPIINDEQAFEKIITPLLSLKSWRLINREVRKACNIYAVEKKLMSCADFQKKFFYEGTMYLRTTYGANAPWTDGTISPASSAKLTTRSIPSTDKADRENTNVKRSKGKGLDPNDPNDMVNIKILSRLAEAA